MLGDDKVITRIEVPIAFEDRDISAGGPKDTQRMVLSVCRSRGLLEYLYDDPPYVLPHPLIKDGAKKGAEGIRRHGSRAYTAFCRWLELNQRNEAEVLRSDLLEEPVYLKGILDIFCMDNAQDINGDFMLLQKAISLHHLLVGGLLALGHTIPVVQRLGTVEAEPHCKTFPCEEATPFFIKEHAVRLYGVCDAPPLALVLSLQFGNLAKIVQPEDGRFPPVPEEIDYRLGGNFNLLNNILFQQVVGHMKRFGPMIKHFLWQIITIVTAQVAGRTGRFYEDLKFS